MNLSCVRICVVHAVLMILLNMQIMQIHRRDVIVIIMNIAILLSPLSDLLFQFLSRGGEILQRSLTRRWHGLRARTIFFPCGVMRLLQYSSATSATRTPTAITMITRNYSGVSMVHKRTTFHRRCKRTTFMLRRRITPTKRALALRLDMADGNYFQAHVAARGALEDLRGLGYAHVLETRVVDGEDQVALVQGTASGKEIGTI